jgi:pSer/pThr/pTyr-binding forkhead associated (FHA) protein
MRQKTVVFAQLVHISGPLKGEIQEFLDREILIGRHPSCLVLFPPEEVLISRNHARIVREGNTFRIVDSSTNGTFVNGKRVKDGALKNGDVITLGEGGPKFSFLSEVKEGLEIPDVPGTPAPPGVSGEPVPSVEVPKEREKEKPEPFDRKQREVPLVIQYGPTLRSFKMVPVTIGKHPACEVVLDHPALLDRHAEFFFSEEQYWIRDLTGSNVVRVNQVPVGSTGLPVNMNDEVLLAAEGPGFRFLGQGRFVECELQPDEKATEQPQEAAPATGKDTGTSRDRKSLFKKYFRH